MIHTSYIVSLTLEINYSLIIEIKLNKLNRMNIIKAITKLELLKVGKRNYRQLKN